MMHCLLWASGELAYEINVKSDHGMFMWEKMMELGKEFGNQPYGTEALSTLRIEMGHVAGPELDGRTLGREAFNVESRQKIVGLIPIDRKSSIPEGSHIVQDQNAKLPGV